MSWCSCKGAIEMRNLLFSVLMLLPVLVFAEGVPEAADTTAGKAVYSQTCIACHGAD
jgi:mono/diheme cytochrome c family protein